MGAEREIGYDVAQLLFQLVIKVKVGTAALAALLFFTSCGGGSMPESEPQPSVVKRPVATTSTTVFKGNDCNREKVEEFSTKFPKQTSSPDEQVSSFTTFRSYVRRLDLQTVQREQNDLVDSLRDYISAWNRAIATQGRDQSARDALLPVLDAIEDFVYAFARECA